MQIAENLNDLGNKLKEIDLGQLQRNFLQTKIGQMTDMAIDEGIKYLMPDFIEDDAIEIKNTLFTKGLKDALEETVNKTIDLGKTAIGIFTGDFDNIAQAEKAVKEGGMIDGISDAIDSVLKKLSDAEIISPSVSKLIKTGKKEILNNVEKNIKNEFLNESKSLEKLEKYINNWNKYYLKKDLEGINKEYKKINKEEKNILPIKNIVENINKINNIHELIKNSNNFDFDKIYLELSNNL